MSKIINEAAVNKIMDKIVDKLKKGNIKRVKKSIDKELGLSKEIEEFEKSYNDLMKRLDQEYGDKLKVADERAAERLRKLNKELGIE